MALLAPASPFIALNVMQLMDNLLKFPVEPNSILGAGVWPLRNQRLCRQLAQDKPIMERMVFFILTYMSGNLGGTNEWTDLEWVAYNGLFLFKTLIQAMGGVGKATVTVRIPDPKFSDDGKEVISRQAPRL